MEKVKKQNGITLIVLMLSVIVMLILVGVSTNILINGRILKRTKETVDRANNKETEQAEQKENIQINWDDLPGETIKSPTKYN